MTLSGERRSFDCVSSLNNSKVTTAAKALIAVCVVAFYWCPAGAQSVDEAKNMAEVVGAWAGLMSVCNNDKSGLNKLERWIALVQDRDLQILMYEYAKIGVSKGEKLLMFMDDTKEWIKVDCSIPYIKNKLGPSFNQMMDSSGVH
jgi:hypothetical protein